MVREEVKILVIDDVNTMRIQIRDLLKMFGFQKISLAGSGEEARKILGVEPFDLVLCDWHMEPGDGFEVLKFVRGDAKLKGVSFIMVTAESTKEKVLEAIQSGVDDYLIKPLTVAQIQTKVYGVLVKKGVL
jgi:two-component system, chemotaxis family, chemotaxis protein CheY